MVYSFFFSRYNVVMTIETPKEIIWASEVQVFIKDVETGKEVVIPQDAMKKVFFLDKITRFLDHNEEKYRGDKEGREFLGKLKSFLS